MMKINRIEHIGIVFDDLAAARAFFLDFGLEVVGEMDLESELVDRVNALGHVRTSIVHMRVPGGEAQLELIKYHTPADEHGIQPSAPNRLGIRHILFAVEDIEALVARLKGRGTEFLSEIQNYENTYKLCYCRGPEGIILELAEKIG
jgi:catechol 2,3-dioxygenase-like lactoylglutathione lyase family enzyme